MRANRDEWRAAQPSLDPDRRVFADGAWAGTNMTRTHGRCPKGRRLVVDVPHGRRKTATLAAALRADGPTAPVVVDGAMTGDVSTAHAGPQLVPAVRRGDVVVMDNLACHPRAGVRAAIEAVGCEFRLLPAYSPDPNPIERAFSELRAKLGAAAKRTVAASENYLGQLVDAFDPQECRNDFRSCGYTDATPAREPL